MASLYLSGQNVIISNTTDKCNIDVNICENNRPTDRTVLLRFPIDSEKLHYIEKYRKENISFTVKLDIYYGIYTSIELNRENNVERKRFISEFGSEKHTLLGFTVEHSFWVNNILSKLGNPFRLIEVPEYSKLVPEEYKTSIAELEQAKKYYTQNDYDKAVEHCRNALDPFKDGVRGLKKHIESKSEAQWNIKITEASIEWLNVMFNETSSLSSKPHHAPSMDHFDKREAEIIYIITVGIIAYIGKIGINSTK